MRFGILNEFAVTQQRITEILDLVQRFSLSASGKIVEVSTAIARAFESGNKILICGNGGSAADSQHFAAEFVSSFSKLIKRQGLPAIALTVDTSLLLFRMTMALKAFSPAKLKHTEARMTS